MALCRLSSSSTLSSWGGGDRRGVFSSSVGFDIMFVSLTVGEAFVLLFFFGIFREMVLLRF